MVALVDCNNFYASCERVFNPKIANSPVIVLSNNDGCVIARSNEAKLLGVKMGYPAFKLKGLIEKYNINVFSTNFALYGDLSKRVIQTIRTEVNKIEIYSIDEAFLDFSDYASKCRGVVVREKVMKWTGIPVSIGIAPNKVLAKVAAHIAKKHTKSGVFLFDNTKLITRALNVFPVEDLWGVGRKNAKKLMLAGIFTALQFRDYNSDWVKKNLSVNGLRIQKELAGDICYPIISSRRKKHSICTSRSLRLEVNEISILKQEIGSHANSCATKLRKQKGCCTKVGVFLGTNPFKQYNKQHYPYKIIRLDVPTNDSMELVSIAVKALESIYRDDFFYKKSGVVVGGIVPQEQMQLSFFDGLDRIRRKRLNKAVDKINSLMGSRKVHLAVETGSKNRKLMQERLSPCYTTRFSDLLEVSI